MARSSSLARPDPGSSCSRTCSSSDAASSYAMRFTNLDLLAERRRPLARAGGVISRPVFALAALAALLVALARPQTTIAVPRDEASVVLAIDVSGSMMATDVPPTRLAAAKQAASTFVEGLPERFGVGLVSFSTGATALAEPTEDRDEILDLVDGLEAHTGTAIGDAIASALDLAPEVSEDGEAPTDAEGKPLFSILLLSDGASTQGISTDDAIGLAKDAGVAVHTIALGTDAGTVTIPNELGEPQTVSVAPDRETLQEIASETRRHVLRRAHGGRPERGLRSDRVPGRLGRGEAGGDGRLRGRRRVLPLRRVIALRALVRPASLTHVTERR